jgi:hypothetical protein
MPLIVATLWIIASTLAALAVPSVRNMRSVRLADSELESGASRKN